MLGRERNGLTDGFELKAGRSDIQGKPTAADERLGPHQKQVAPKLLPIERQRPNAFGIIANDPRPLEKPGSQFEGQWSGSCGITAKAIGETIELEPSSGSVRAVCDQRQGLVGKIAVILAKEPTPLPTAAIGPLNSWHSRAVSNSSIRMSSMTLMVNNATPFSLSQRWLAQKALISLAEGASLASQKALAAMATAEGGGDAVRHHGPPQRHRGRTGADPDGFEPVRSAACTAIVV